MQVTMYNHFADCAARYPELPFIYFKNEVYTYRSFLKLTESYRALLQQIDNCDEVICLAGNNTPGYIAALLAAFATGHPVSNINPGFTTSEISERMSYVKSKTLLVQVNSVPQAAINALQQHGINCYFFDATTCPVASTTTAPVAVTGNHTAFIQFTGGTTGAYKAAVITHQNILENGRQIAEHLGTLVPKPGESVLVTIPFYHTFSLVFNVFTWMRAGAVCILIENVRQFDDLFASAQQHKPVLMVAVNTMYNRMMQHPEFKASHFESLRVSLAGGEKVQGETKLQWKQKTGKNLYEAYGLTETTAMLTCNYLDERNTADCVGVPLHNTQIKLTDEKGNIISHTHTAGVIWVKGPQVTSRYYNNTTANAELFNDGWFNTGDIGEWETGGYLRILDRAKDMIAVSGIKVYPAEVDAVLMEVAGVLDCACLGVKDEHTGEKIVAYIVSNSPVNEDELIAHCQKKLAAYKIPKQFIAIDSIPKSAIGKTSRHLLKQITN